MNQGDRSQTPSWLSAKTNSMAANQTHAVTKMITPAPTLPHISEKDIRRDAAKPRRHWNQSPTQPLDSVPVAAGPVPLLLNPIPRSLSSPRLPEAAGTISETDLLGGSEAMCCTNNKLVCALCRQDRA